LVAAASPPTLPSGRFTPPFRVLSQRQSRHRSRGRLKRPSLMRPPLPWSVNCLASPPAPFASKLRFLQSPSLSSLGPCPLSSRPHFPPCRQRPGIVFFPTPCRFFFCELIVFFFRSPLLHKPKFQLKNWVQSRISIGPSPLYTPL